jgi:hypothetical protein
MVSVKRFSSQPEHHRSDIVSSCIGALPSGKVTLHGVGDFFSTGSTIGFENFL